MDGGEEKKFKIICGVPKILPDKPLEIKGDFETKLVTSKVNIQSLKFQI